MGCATAALAQSFPLGQVLVLDAPRIGALKRVPVITTEPDGTATVDLWCKTVPARLTVEGAAIRVETAPLPEALPQYMMSGQCSEERMQADINTLTALTQSTGWQRRGDRITLAGPDGATPLRFTLSSH
ncbi:MAG: META domain-containing protein [Proteobacteria bacterium]|nr:META domain-containing protein [Pseudomonadota bacterium]